MIILMALYIACSATGLVLIKMGTNQGFGLEIANGIFNVRFGGLLMVGLLLYVTSFILSMLAMSKMNLTFFYPLSAGLIYILVCLLGVFLLKEKVVVEQLIGIALILAGIVVMNIRKA